MKLLFISPMIVPLMVIGVGFYVVFARIHLLGGFLSLGLAHTVLVLPFVILPVTARLTSLDSVLERAAASLGAGPFPTLYRVVLPLLAPATLAGFVFAFIFSFDEVVVAQFLSGATLETLPRLMWEGVSVGGLDKTITAVTTVQIAIAVGTILLIQAWQRRPQRLAVMAMPAETPDRNRARATVGHRQRFGGDGWARFPRTAQEAGRQGSGRGSTRRRHDLRQADQALWRPRCGGCGRPQGRAGQVLTLLGPSGSARPRC